MVKFKGFNGGRIIYFVDLRELRLGAGLSQDELAFIVGCSINTISSIELGHYDPDLAMILKLCFALNCSFSDLVIANYVDKFVS